MKMSFEKTMMAVGEKLGVGCPFETMCLFVALAGVLLSLVFVLMSSAVFSISDAQVSSQPVGQGSASPTVVTVAR